MAEEGKDGVAGKAVAVVLVLGLLAGGLYLWSLRDPANGKAADWVASLSVERTQCENAVIALHEKKIAGKAEYEKARAVANATVDYLLTVMDQGGADEKAIEGRMKKFSDETAAFRGWADQQLKVFGAKEGIDPAEFAKEMLSMLKDREMERRKAVKARIEAVRFQSWDKIVAAQ